MLCTREPLVPQTVMGAFWAVAAMDDVKVTVSVPLTGFCWLKVAVTPAGTPLRRRLTAPRPNELTRSVATALPAVMVYARLVASMLKSANAGAGALQLAGSAVAGMDHVEL